MPVNDREKFKQIFSGLERAYGQTLSRSKNDKGKIETQSWIEKKDLTQEQWDIHLDGKEPSLGIIPIRDDNTCTWGAIDIDSYKQFDHKELVKTIVDKKLPLVVCKSKSGGAHVFLFVKEPCTAREMQIKLTEIAAWIGYGGVEIFPRQIELNSKGTGNFLNLPYNSTEFPTRYAFDDEGNALDNLGMFIEHYEKKVLSNIDMLVIEKAVTENNNDDFKGAPPCIVTLISQGLSEGNRNQCMFQLGVYLRQRYPDDLENKMDQYNIKYFQPPLSSKEVQTLYKQVEDKKYFYKCEDPVFATVCEKIRCQTRKFGIGNSAKNDIHGLKKWVSDNPMYELTHNGKVIILTLDQLSNNGEYRKQCIAQANESPRPVAPAVWSDIVDALLKSMREEDFIMLPGEVTAKGQFLDLLKSFIYNQGGAKERQDLLQGIAYEDEGYIYFRPPAFREFLKRNRFTKMSDSYQFKIFAEFGGTHTKIKINNDPVHVWKIPSVIKEQEYIVKDNDFKQQDPY